METFIGIHALGGYTSVRHVHRFSYHEKADICIGILDKYDPANKLIYDKEIKYPHLIPNFEIPKIGELVTNFGYGNSSVVDKEQRIQTGNFPSQWYEGPVTQILMEGRDTSTLPGATIEGQYDTIGKASGGPVFNTKGEVIGVNSTSMPGEPPISYFTPINQILNLKIIHPIYGEIESKELFKKINPVANK